VTITIYKSLNPLKLLFRVYVGEYSWKDKESEEEFKIVLPQIISHSLFNRVQKMIDKNTKNKGNNLRKFDCLLGDLLILFM
jgi:hypothetical protein